MNSMRVQTKTLPAGVVTIIYTDGKHDCPSNPNDRIDAEPVNGGLKVTWHEDNQPVTKYQAQIQTYSGIRTYST